MTARNNSVACVTLRHYQAQLWNYPSVFSPRCMTTKGKMSTPRFPCKYLRKLWLREKPSEREKETQRGEGISWNIHVTFSLMLHLNYRRASHANPIGRLCQEIHNHSEILITPVGFELYLICTRHRGHYQPCVSASALRVSGNQI